MYKRVHVIINPASGKDEPVLSFLNNVFMEAEVKWDAYVTKYDDDIREIAAKFSRQKNIDAILAYGGDDTVAEVAAGLADSKIPLGILPGGTANVMAFEFGIPVNVEQAARIAVGLSGPTELRQFDLGRADNRIFMVRLSIGLFAEMVVRADRASKDRFGRMAYTLAALEAIQDTPETLYRIEMENETVEVRGISCLIANSGSVGMRAISLSPRINISDGLLDVVVVRYVDLPTIAALVAGADPLTNDAFPALQHWQAREVTVSAEPEQTVAIDGEPFGATPCRAAVMPAAVNVIVPAASVPPRRDASDQGREVWRSGSSESTPQTLFSGLTSAAGWLLGR